MLRGRGETVDRLNPGEGERVAEEDVRILCSNCGFVVDVYCPGSKCTEEAPWAESVAPTNVTVRVIPDTIYWERTSYVGKTFKTLTRNAYYRRLRD